MTCFSRRNSDSHPEATKRPLLLIFSRSFYSGRFSATFVRIKGFNRPIKNSNFACFCSDPKILKQGSEVTGTARSSSKLEPSVPVKLK